jgi:N-acetylmuramoyl-L-alanine amidase
VALSLAFAASIPRIAGAAGLEQVLVFLGRDHARILLLLDGPPGEVSTSSVAAVGSAPARAVLQIQGVSLAPRLQQAYRSRPGGTEMPVGQQGVRQIVLSGLGDGLQVAVELDRARTASLGEVGDRALLLDLRLPDSPADTSLPDPAYLAAWMAGTAAAPVPAEAPHPRPRIIIDPGHGGWDSGAVGCRDTRESDVVLSLSRRVAAALRRELDAEVSLTREDDRYLTLHERAAIANAQGADVFLSIHANAAPTPDLWGVETYYLDVASDANAAAVARRENEAVRRDGQPAQTADLVLGALVVSGTGALSSRLAREVQGAVVGRLGDLLGPGQTRDLGVKSAMFTVLVSTRMPSILFESSFLTNPDDEARLRTPAIQREEADAIARGVAAYLAASGSQP